ncbi:PLP-dependent aminotransferase family protein [Lysinibacillus halotolerans]|uniref:PLP-dependent aminotransferase family protein n=1 Tax=Lysinibacillus halotolerans TaxID=1368476 RepID=A0A3M8H4D7_9BACI|nr:PLP-dependent aminotransferase family protein [Lysinibacillus halotolerans]RNC97315.1 PLP-dependent aminotransferase family protein [Lysinibacillus halotolerans]
MELQIIFSTDEPKYMTIYKQIKKQVLTNVIHAHEQLPPKRLLANQLNVSIQTVQTAYEQLISEGFIYTIERNGYYVSEVEFPYSFEDSFEPIVEIEENENPTISFRNGQVDASHFPFSVWTKYVKEHFQSNMMPNAKWQGEAMLRNQIARYIRKARGIHCQPKQIFIFNGTQQQLKVLSQFLKPTAVGIENPGFHRVYYTWKQSQLEPTLVPVDEQGCMVPTVPLNLLYTTPAHQFPKGTIMSITRKGELLQWAATHQSYIIEDDYDAEFRYKGNPIPPLAQLDYQDRVIYFGSFSKTMIPSIRVSYIILPMHLVDSFEQFMQFDKSMVSRLDQVVLAHFMKDGHFEKHIAKMRKLYSEKRQHLIDEIKNRLGDEFIITGDDAGLHIVLHLPDYLTEQQALQKAKSVGVTVDAYSQFQFDRTGETSNKVVIGYGTLSLEQITQGIAAISTVWKSK